MTMQGRTLQALARDKLAQASGTMLSRTFAKWLDRLPIEWDGPRASGEVNAIAPSFTNALRYAYLNADGAVPPLDSHDACTIAIEEILRDNTKAAIFRDNVWRSPTSFSPLRGVPLQYILRHRYGDTATRGIDVGAGLHILMPMLNSQRYFDADVPHKDELAPVSGRVNVALGLGVDKQDRDILWALASCPWSRTTHVERLRDWLTNEQQFPFLVADISDAGTAHRINTTINPTGDTPHVHFVVSFFCRYQLNDDEPTKRSYQQFAPTFLLEGGILIEDGEEVAPKEFRVNVYQKTAGEMRLRGSPFTIATHGQILSVDLTYFANTPMDFGA